MNDFPHTREGLWLAEPGPVSLYPPLSGKRVADGRTMLHYFRTTKDGRIAFGWGGGRMGYGARKLRRLEFDREVIDHTARNLRRFFPALRDKKIVHAWGGPIDVSPTHLPIFGTRGRAHHGFGFTGNGVGPGCLGGEILERLALDRRDEFTRLPLVNPPREFLPPEPFRWAGGSAIRYALPRKGDIEDAGDHPGRLVSLARRIAAAARAAFTALNRVRSDQTAARAAAAGRWAHCGSLQVP